MVLKVKVTLKSGAVVKFRAKRLVVKTNRLNETTGVEWTNTRLGTHLFDIKVEDIAAITTRRWFW